MFGNIIVLNKNRNKAEGNSPTSRRRVDGEEVSSHSRNSPLNVESGVAIEGNPQDHDLVIRTSSSNINKEEEDALAVSTSSSRTARVASTPLNIRAGRLLHRDEEHANTDDDDEDDDDAHLQRPLLSSHTTPARSNLRATSSSSSSPTGLVRARKTASKRRRRKPHGSSQHATQPSLTSSRTTKSTSWLHACLLWCCRNNSRSVQSTYTCMNVMARLLFWGTVMALVAAVFWYSYELFTKGTEAHLIAWFSAGAFVLLGFPISMWGIVSHLANYNQPHVQVYIVRILWMVPIYSIESWLAMRFHKQAIYIETLRDFYESYVLYSFLQFLIQVLGGEEALILMLKDKSPTRGHHMWGLQYCVKPWQMGQPIRKTVYERSDTETTIKRVHWTSPFFVKCKFGVLQYVLLKFLSAIAVLLLEWKGLYKEGEFSWTSGYAYICAITNISQCWALYCLIFFYYATHTELSPIRPVGKFLSVKALVFFTWWQSVIIALLYQWGMIPESLENVEHDWTKEAVAKGIQDYLICIEMFVAAVVHSFVFPHTEYSPQAVEARSRALNQAPVWQKKKRLGRNHHGFAWIRDDVSKSSAGVELMSVDSGSLQTAETWEEPVMWQTVQPQLSPKQQSPARQKDLLPLDEEAAEVLSPVPNEADEDDDDGDGEEDYDETSAEETSDYDEEEQTVTSNNPGFVRALIDTAIPRDLGDSTIGIVKGDYTVEKKTLLHHAATYDQYDLFSPNRRRLQTKKDHPAP